MKDILIDRDELKKLMSEVFKETLIEVLSQRKDLIEDVLLESLLDIGLVTAMEEGKTGEYISNDLFMEKIDKKIVSL
ncbi:MAG: hypothetical protein HQK91_00685 [Nitrospirae bacterium]|nr:hypothetical protein [Nitrospirota bacterium]MBF0539953.1 hypothetical protein [Nitrospirota bacterium]